MPTTSTTVVCQLGYGASDGTVLGASPTEPIAFYGTAPKVQRAVGNNTLLTAGSTTTVQTSVMIEIQATLVALGLMPAT